MNRVVAGLRGIEEAARTTEQSLQSARLGQEVRRQMRSAAGSTATLERPLKTLRQEFRALRAESRNIDFGELGDTRQFKAATQQVHQYVDALESLGNQIEHNTSLEREFAAVVKRQQRIAQERIDMAEQQRKAAVAAQRLAGAQAVQQIGQAVAAPLGAMGRDSIKILSDFNDQMAQVKAVSDMTARELETVRNRAKELGASTRFSASEAASGFVLLAQAGYEVEDQLRAIDGTLNLASAGNLDLARATEITVSTLGQFQLEADKASHAANVLAMAAAMGQLDVSDIGESLKYAGVSAKRAGLSLEQTASMLALLSEGGLKGEMAGSALGQMLDGLVAPASTGAAALANLGVQTTDATGKLLPYEKILGRTIEALSKVSDESERASIQNKIFGVVGGRAAGILTPRYERIAKATAEIGKSADAGVGAAIKQSRIMEDTLGGSFRNFSSAMEGLKISLVEPLEPIIRAIIDTGSAVASFFAGLPGPIRGVISVGMGLTFVLAGLSAAIATVGIAAFGMQQAAATSSVGLLALRSSAIPLTGFFQTAMGAFSASGLAGLRRFAADLTLLPGPLGQVMVLIRGVGMAIATTPFGMAIAGFAALLALAEVLTPGFDLLGTTITLLVAPFRILGGLASGVLQGFGAAIDEISGQRLSPVAQEFAEFAKGLIDQIDSLEMSANSLGQSIGKAIAKGLAPLFTVQAAISRAIFSIWRGTITAITHAFDPLLRFARWVGNMLVSSLAENSPGPTAQIRQRWDETVQHVQDVMGQLVGTAQQVGQAVWQAFSWVAEGVARLFREVFGHLLVSRLVKQTDVLGVRIHNRVFGLLNDILTLPVELGSPATMFFDGLLARLTVVEEVLVAIAPAMRIALTGIIPVTLQSQIVDLNNSLLNYIRSLGGVEGVVMRSVGSFDLLLKVASFLFKAMARYPGLMAGLRQGLTVLGRFAGLAGLILSLADSLRTLSFLAQGLQRVLANMGVPSGWLDPVITGLNQTIQAVQNARQAFVGFARSILYGDWGSAAQQFSSAWTDSIALVQRMLGSPLLADLQVFSPGSMKSVLDDQKTWINSLQADVSLAIANPIVLLAAGIKAGKSLGKAITTGLVKQIDGVAKKFVSDFSTKLNATSGAALSVALLSLFFAPAGIPRLIAGFAPALVVALTNSGVLQKVQAWIVKGFGGLLERVDQAFGRQEWLHRLGEAFGLLDVIAKGTGTVIDTLAKSMSVRLGAAIAIVSPTVQSLINSLKEIYQIGGVPAVLQNLQVITRPLALALQQIASSIQQMGTALAGLAATSPLFRQLMASVGTAANLLMRIPLVEQLGAFAVSMGLGRRLMGMGQSAVSTAQQGGKVAINGMQQVIQLMLWIGQGVYQIAEPGGTSLKKVPSLLSRILGVASKILNPLPALVGLSGKATDAGGIPRITPVDILSQFLPEFLIPATEKAIAGTKVRKILAARQPGFEEFDPFKQRELVGRYVERLSNPLGLINTPLFGPVVMASIELVGGSLLGLIATIGLAAGALYVFKPELAKPLAGFFQVLAKGVVGLAFVLVQLGHSSRDAADSIDVLGLKLKAPGWAIATSKALNAMIRAVGAVAVAFTQVVDFALGIVPTLIRSTLLLVPIAFIGITKLMLQAIQGVLRRVRDDTKRLGDAIVAGVRQGDWSQLGSILKEAFMNALNVTLIPIARLVKYIAWDLIISPIASAVWWGLTTVGNAIGSVLLHPIRTINFLVNAIKAIGVAVASIRLVGLLQAFTRVSTVVYEFESAVGTTGVAIAAIATVASVALDPIIALVMGAVVAIGVLVQSYRDNFSVLTAVINGLQWAISSLQERMATLVQVFATPIKPLDWLFSPIANFLSGAGDKFVQWFPTILAAFVGLQVARKGLVGGFVSAFSIIAKAILSVVSAISQAITGMIRLGGKTREFSQTLEGEVMIEQARRVGRRAGQRFGLFQSNEPQAIQAERDQQFLEKSAIVRFRKSVQQTLKKTGGSLESISEEVLQQLAAKSRLDTSGVPGVVPLRELAARDSGQLEEIRDLYQQNIDNLKTADMRAQTVTLVSDKVEASNVVSITRGTTRKLSTPEDVSSLRFGAAELRALANMPGGERLRSGAGLSQEASRLETTLGEAAKRLEDIPLSVLKNLAQAVGVYQPRTSRDEDYRFLNTYKDQLDKQGLPGVQKQLLMLQILARTDQIPTPQELTKGIVSAEEALKAIHGALEHLYRAANVKGEGQADAFNQMAIDTLRGQLPFLTNQDVANVISLLDKNPNPDRIMMALQQVLDTQVDLFLQDSPIFTPVQEAAQKMEQVIQTTATEAIAQMPKGGLWAGLGKRLKVAVHDFMDSDRVRSFIENRQEQKQQRQIAAMTEQRRMRVAAIQRNSGASNQLDFLRRIGAIQDPTTQILEQRQRPVPSAPSSLPPAPPPPREYPMLPDPWEETEAERFFKGLARFTRSLRRQIPEVSEQTVEFFRTINRDGERSLERVNVVPLYRRMLMGAAGGARQALNQAATLFDRRAGIKPPEILQKPSGESPRIAGLLPAAREPVAPSQPGGNIQNPFKEIERGIWMFGTFYSTDKIKSAWKRTSDVIQNGIWPRLVNSAKQVGRKILSYIAENSPGPTAQIRQRYHETADSVVADMHHMEAAAARTGQKIKHSLVGGVGRAGVAIFGALSATGFATQSIASSLSTLGILDESTSDALFKFTELFSIVGAVGSLAAPLFGAVAATLGALIPIITTVGGAIATFLIGPIGLASGAIIGSLLLINEATKRLFGIDFIAPVVGRVMMMANAIRQPLDWAANWIEARWQQFRDRFAPILAPIVEPALEVAQQLINALNHNPTEVIPLAWEEAVQRIIGWISQLPGIGEWAAKQLNKVMQPGGVLSRWGATVKRWFSDLKQSPDGAVIAPTKKELPPLPPPPKVTAAEQWGDMMTALQRSGDPSQVLTPGLDQATYGFQFLLKSARQFGEESGAALKRLDFGALTGSAKAFGDRFLMAASIVGQGFGSMTMGALAFGVTSLLSLGPVILTLGGIGLAALAVATNFLGLRTIVVGAIRAIVGIVQILATTLKGVVQITAGLTRVLAGALAMLGGNFEMIHHGIAQVIQGVNTISFGLGQGLRNLIGGAVQMLRGAFQGLGQVARFTLGAIQRSGALIATTFRQIIQLTKGVGNALLNALTQPQKAWNRFVGTLQQAKNVISRIAQSPRIAADTVGLGAKGKAPRIPESYQMAEFDDRLRSIPFVGNYLANQQANNPERFNALSDAFAGLTGVLSALSPALAAPLMLFSGLLDSVVMLATSIPILKPMILGFAATLKGMGTAAGFAATMNTALTTAQTFLTGALTIGMGAAKAFWAAISGPLLPVVVAIGLIVAGVWALLQAFNVFGRIGQLIGGIVQSFREAWGIIDRAFRDAFGGIMIALNQLGDAIASPFEPLLQLFGASGGAGLAGLISGTFRIALNPILLVAQGIGLVVRLIGAVVAGVIQAGAYITRKLLSPVAIALEWIIGAFRDTFGFIGETLMEVGNSLAEPFEPLLNMFGTSGAGGLVDLLGRGISMLLSPLEILGFAVSMVVRLFGVVLVGAIRLVGTVLKPIISVILTPFRVIATVIQGVVWLLQQIPALMSVIANGLLSVVPEPLRWLVESAQKITGNGPAATGPTPQRFSTGGLVTGPSGGDVIPALLSNREFVVNQNATRQNLGFLEAINAGVPAEKALGLMQIAPPPIVRPSAQAIAAPADATQPISVQVNLTFTGNIMVSGNSGEEVASEMMQHLEPKLQIAIREALRDMVERMR